MTELDRRTLLAGGAALAAVGASSAAAQAPAPSPVPSLAGKAILVTGTSSGFGRLGALLYARAGARVFATMRGLPRTEGRELAEIARAEKLDLHVLPLDVMSDRQVVQAIARAEAINQGPLDVLVNNAGIGFSGPVEMQDMPSTQLLFDTNVYGPQRTARAVLTGMRRRKAGLIVNVSSQQGRIIMPGSGLYSASKFALEAMSEQMAYELAQHGIEVSIIQPGGFPTGIGKARGDLSAALAARSEAERKSAYPDMVARMVPPPPGAMANVPPSAFGSSVRPDPEDVPRAIAEIIAMPAGSRPLRRPVHPGTKPQIEINRVSRETQLQIMSRPPMSAWAQNVLD